MVGSQTLEDARSKMKISETYINVTEMTSTDKSNAMTPEAFKNEKFETYFYNL